MKGYTNTLSIFRKSTNLDRDFDFFVLIRSDNNEDKKRLAVWKLESANLPIQGLYNGYRQVVIMTYKNEICFDDISTLDFSGFEVKKRGVGQLEDEVVLNLLFAFHGMSHPDMISNIGGEVFLGVAKNKSNVERYVLKINYNFKVLKVTVQSFKKVNNLEKNNFGYEWPVSSSVPRRTYTGKKKGSWQKGKSEFNKDKKNNVHFFANSEYSHLERSKVGRIFTFLEDFNREMGDYIRVDLGPIDESVTSAEITTSKRSFLEREFTDIPDTHLYIVDHIQTAESKGVAKKIRKILKNQKISRLYVKTVAKTQPGMNLVLINHPDYYKKNGIKDPYEKSHDDKIIQHIWKETLPQIDSEANLLGSARNAVLFKILQELTVKRDILAGKLSKTFIQKLGLSDTIHYWSIEGKKSARLFICCSVSVSGTMEFQKYTPEEFDTSADPLVTQVRDILKFKKVYKENLQWKLEGLYIFDDAEAVLIQKSDLTVYPNINTIRQRLKLARPEIVVQKRDISEDFERFDRENENKEGTQLVWDALKNLPDEFTLKEFRAEMKSMNKSGRDEPFTSFNHFLEANKKGYRPYSNHKGKIYLDDYTPLMGINFLKKVNGYRPAKAELLYYWVGLRGTSIRPKYSKGPVVRKVYIQKPSKFIKEDFVKMLDVDFVRVGEATVIPFFAKYNREYYNLIQNCK